LKRQDFEAGKWEGKKLKTEYRYFDNMYNRVYEPDQIKKLNKKLT